MTRSNPMIDYAQLIARSTEAFDNHLNVRDEFKGLTVSELQEISNKNRYPFYTMVLNLTGDLNTANIIRTSHLLGCSGVFLVGRRKYDKRGTVGAENYVPVHRIHALLEDGITFDRDAIKSIIAEHKMLPIFVETGRDSLVGVKWPMRLHTPIELGYTPTLIFGNEGLGIPKDILELVFDNPWSFIVSVNMTGVLRSYNVSIAHSIITWDLCKEMGWAR